MPPKSSWGVLFAYLGYKKSDINTSFDYFIKGGNMRRSSLFSCALVLMIAMLCILGCNDPLNGDLTSVQPSNVYTVTQLISESRSAKKTDGQEVIAVKGTVHEVNTVNGRNTILLKGDMADEAFVICDMNTNQSTTAPSVKRGDSVLIKGLLKGILKDVIMLNCVVVKTE